MYEIPVQIKKLIRKSRQNKYLAFLFLAIFILALGGGVKLCSKVFEEDKEAVFYDNFSDNSNYSKIEIQQISYPFAYYMGNSTHQLYFALDQEIYPYIVCMSDSQFTPFQELLDYTYSENEAEPPEPVAVYGVPVPMDEELKEQALEYTDLFFGEGIIDSDNFEGWLGVSYLDATLTPSNPMDQIGTYIMALGFILLIAACISMIYWKKYNKITDATCAAPEFGQMAAEADRQLLSPGTACYQKSGLYLTDDYIVSWKPGFQIIPYEQILSVKEAVKETGLKSSHYLALTMKDGSVRQLSPAPQMNKKWSGVYQEIISAIRRKIPEENQTFSPFTGFDNSNPDDRGPILAETAGQAQAARLMEQEVRSNPILGMAGAFLFSLAGVVVWIAIGKAGFIAGIAGYLIMNFAMRGYRTFGKTLDKKGAVISFLVTVIMIFAANWLGFWLELYLSFSSGGGGHITVFSVLKEMPALMEEYDLWGDFFLDLLVGYLLSVWSCFSMIKAVFSKK